MHLKQLYRLLSLTNLRSRSNKKFWTDIIATWTHPYAQLSPDQIRVVEQRFFDFRIAKRNSEGVAVPAKLDKHKRRKLRQAILNNDLLAFVRESNHQKLHFRDPLKATHKQPISNPTATHKQPISYPTATHKLPSGQITH